MLVAKLFFKMVGALGGFVVDLAAYSSTVRFVQFSDLPRNISWTVEGMIAAYGAYFFGQPPGLRVVFCAINLLLMGAVFYGLWQDLVMTWRQTVKIDRLSSTLATGMAILLLSYVLSTLPSGLDTIRYFVPFTAMGAVLTGRFLLSHVPDRRKLLSMIAFGGVAGALFLCSQMRVSNYEPRAQPLATWLVGHHLKNGYGSYWCCADTVALAHDRVRPIMERNGAMAPFLWAVSSDWYHESANFVVADKSNEEGVSEKALRKAFGAEAKRYVVGPFIVMVYDHDLTPLLAPVSSH